MNTIYQTKWWLFCPLIKSGKEMATHTQILAWDIPWTEEPGVGGAWSQKRRTLLSDQTVTTVKGQNKGIVGRAGG